MYQKEIAIINLYAPNYNKHTLKDLKAQTDSNTVVVGDFYTPLLPTDRSSKQKINKEILEINYIIDHVEFSDAYGVFRLTTAQHTFF
jgi:hypothetical protein